MPRINLLPWRDAERRQKRQEFAVGAVGALLIAGLITFLVNWQMQAAIDRQNDRNQFLKNEITALDKQIAEILDLEEQKQNLLSRMQVIEQLQRSRPEVVHLFDQLVRTLPEGVHLTDVKQTDRRVQLKGMAQSSTRVSSYMRNIDASEWLTEPSLEILETKGAGDAGSQFTLYATQINPLAPADADESLAATQPPARGARR